ncbi:homoserine O-acetyltransferase MetX [Desmospora profundinema]|uniref:Homoserine O-acetyltransferase n=1 Tax=Desmospora profundinema TaxID=1571184 RepID=A0ABU1IP22_9BACL|nr:homoserine O-acetyltransferase [Desmospora profundinema]MDR6226493.1 homoserine O-acetyltransferase [Desmospora profundinema]
MRTVVKPVDRRQVAIGPFSLECGEVLPAVEVAVEIAGAWEPGRDNVILICHALTGDAHAVGDQENPGWWDGLAGTGKPLDTDRYALVTMNVLGGCDGTTGPASLCPESGRPYGSSFPLVTIRDMVRLQREVLIRLQVDRLQAVIGGSMGGMMVLEWGILYPEVPRRLIPIATSASLTSMAIAYNEIARQAIRSDPDFAGGDYYPDAGPVRGLSVARMVGMVTYRTPRLFEHRFGRELQRDGSELDKENLFQVESYLRHQGQKLVERFDANSYLTLLKAMDTHDIGRGRGGVRRALAHVEASVLMVGIEDDQLFPAYQQREIHRWLMAEGKQSDLFMFPSDYGHDAFLVQFDRLGPRIEAFLSD